MQKSFMLKKEEVNRQWYVIDAAGLTVGRLSTEIATRLMGKHKPTFTPNVDNGDYIVVINAEKVVFTGSKLTQKLYRSHSGYPGGLKETKAETVLATYPERILEHSVKGMLPKNKLGKRMLRKLFVTAGENHAFAAQKPQVLDLGGNK